EVARRAGADILQAETDRDLLVGIEDAVGRRAAFGGDVRAGRHDDRSRRARAIGELEIADARPPVEAARRGVVLLRVPERAVVHGVDAHRAVIAPAVAR